jgi:hypothetical protein
MDECEKYYYIREPQARYRNPGDISEQLALRIRSFSLVDVVAAVKQR